MIKESTEYKYPLFDFYNPFSVPQSELCSAKKEIEELKLEVEYLKRRVEILEGITV